MDHPYISFLSFVLLIFAFYPLHQKHYEQNAAKRNSHIQSLGLTQHKTIPDKFKIDHFKLLKPEFNLRRGNALFSDIHSGFFQNLEVTIFNLKFVGEASGVAGLENMGETAVCITAKEFSIPAFCVKPREKLFGASSLDGREAGYYEFSEFSEHYAYYSDANNLHKLFKENTKELLESTPGLFIESNGISLLVYTQDQVGSPEEWPSFIERATGIYTLFNRE